ncbi:MAG: ComEC/Rec2 family competence protein [Pseudomonadota bacterium]|nr:ComEC/Rec2 family competence protein [Pseudomonadota bacterium]
MWGLLLGLPAGIVAAVLAPAEWRLILVLAGVIMPALPAGFTGPTVVRRQWLIAAVSLPLGVTVGGLAKQSLQPWALQQSQQYILTGTVVDIPQWGDYSRRFRLSVDCLGSALDPCGRFRAGWWTWWPPRVELTVYDNQVTLQPGERVQLRVRPKRSRAASDSGFDVQRWMLTQHLVARLALVKGTTPQTLRASGLSVNRLRSRFNRYLAQRPEAPGWSALASQPVILALLTGDRSLMSGSHWEVFNRTGTTHLVAISGLHIGLVAGFVYWFSLPLLRRWQWLTHRVPAAHGGAVLGWLVALGYAAMAGFALPTQRALIMLTVFLVLLLLGFARQLWFALACAFCLVLVWDPLACLSLGFWLSFAAVFVILWVVGGQVVAAGRGRRWLQVQLGLWAGLAPILLWLVQSVSLISALTNLVAIPVIGFLVVPLVLLWGVLWPLFGAAVDGALQLAIWIQDLLLWGLQWGARWPYGVWQVADSGPLPMLLGLVGVLWLLSAGMPGRIWGWVLLVPMFWPPGPPPGLYIEGGGGARITLLAPGQVQFLAGGHWPRVLARWQSQRLAQWGVVMPPEELDLSHSLSLWQASGPVLTTLETSSDPLGVNRVRALHFTDPCQEPGPDHGTLQLEIWRATKPRDLCALAFVWSELRWLYWSSPTLRGQREIATQLAGRRFDVLVLDLEREQPVVAELLNHLAPGAIVFSARPPAPAFESRLRQAGISRHLLQGPLAGREKGPVGWYLGPAAASPRPWQP